MRWNENVHVLFLKKREEFGVSVEKEDHHDNNYYYYGEYHTRDEHQTAEL